MGRRAALLRLHLPQVSPFPHSIPALKDPQVTHRFPGRAKYFKLDDNQFPVLERGPLAVSCMTYRGTRRYYVEVGVINRSGAPAIVHGDFVSFNKQGYTVLL